MLTNVSAAMENDKNDPLSARDPRVNERSNDPLLMNTEAYSAYYSEASMWDKILKYGRHAGISVIYAGLLLYYLLQKEGLPVQVKAAILGARGYFIIPADVLPDIFVCPVKDRVNQDLPAHSRFHARLNYPVLRSGVAFLSPNAGYHLAANSTALFEHLATPSSVHRRKSAFGPH
jgi:hypothetical protein